MASFKTSCYHFEKANPRLYTRFSVMDIDRIARNDINKGVIVAIDQNNYGAFRIQCTCAGIQWKSIVSKKYCSILHEMGAYEIFLALAKEKKPIDSTVEFDIVTLVYNLLIWGLAPIGKLEEFLNLFVNEYGHSIDELAEIIEDTEFVQRTYGGGTVNFCRGGNNYGPTNIYEMFERLFPGRGLFPNPIGQWTDPRDGKIYETVRVHDTEFVKMPVGGQFTRKEIEELLETQSDKILPEGWRFPTVHEMDLFVASRCAEGELGDLVHSDRLGRVLNKANCGAILFPASSNFPPRQRYGAIIYLHGSVTVHYDESLYSLIHEDYDGTKEINPEYCKMSIFICRDVHSSKTSNKGDPH